ncbi:hypothetical protein ACFLX9_03410 [Chloroflexota bacterium]
MTGMTRYYTSRGLISVALGGLFIITGALWWMAVLVGGLSLAFFLWAPRSGRYVVNRELGVTALRRDEHTQAVAGRAARMAFVVTILVVGGLAIYYASIAQDDVPAGVLAFVVALGWLTNFTTDRLLRHARSG